MLNTTNSDTAAVSEPKKKRILWLDIAKAIAIFAMIEGHTAPYGGALRNFIYSICRCFLLQQALPPAQSQHGRISLKH